MVDPMITKPARRLRTQKTPIISGEREMKDFQSVTETAKRPSALIMINGNSERFYQNFDFNN